MSKLRVHSFSISIDGFGAGPNQDLENPLGVGGLRVFDWFFPNSGSSGQGSTPRRAYGLCRDVDV